MKRIKAEERMLIQTCLAKDMSITEIARRLGRNKSSICREINSHLVIKEGYKDGDCAYRKERVLYNSCRLRGKCFYEKHFYNFEEANKIATEIRCESRMHTRLNNYQLAIINHVLVEQVRGLRRSLHHVYISNPNLEKICSKKAIRRLIYSGFTQIKSYELRKFVVYRHSYAKPKEFQLRNISVLIGRQFSNYLKFRSENKTKNYVEYDSVIGKSSDEKAILTVAFPEYEFQFGILILKSNANDVLAKIKKLYRKLGNELEGKIFPINLADNGVEFSYFNNIETDDNGEFICRTFFTNPYKATDKPHCERYHEFICYMIPKGKSLDFLDQEKVNWIFS